MWWRVLLRAAGGFLLAGALVMTCLLSSFVRLEEAGDLEAVVASDVATGVGVAVGLFLVLLPPAGRALARRVALLAVAAIAAGSVLGGGLAESHVHQFRVRSGPE